MLSELTENNLSTITFRKDLYNLKSDKISIKKYELGFKEEIYFSLPIAIDRADANIYQ
jgi:hypothetical protein